MELVFAFRNLARRPYLNLIKTAGLGISLTGVIVILLYIRSELSFDRFHDNYDRIFRFTVTNSKFLEGKHFARVHKPDYIPDMANYFAEIENYVRLVPVRGGVLKWNENYIRINEAFQCDSTFFKVFKADLISGNADKILDDPATMVLSESFARRVFGLMNPVGQTLTIPSGQYYGKNIDFTVRGVMRDLPRNSHFHPEFITTPENKEEFTGWAWTYLLLNKESSSDKIINGFWKFYSMHTAEKFDDITIDAHLQSISHIHLHSNKLREIEPNGNMFVIITLAFAALILLFISHINYINLNLGMAAYSDRFLQITRVFGSSGFTSVKYYLYEGFIIVAIAIALSIIFSGLAHLLMLKYFSLDLLNGNALFILVIMVVFGLLSLLSGLLLSLKQQINNISTGFIFQSKKPGYRKGISKGLIVIQYAVSAALVVSVIVMLRQMNYAIKTSMGDDSGELICFEDLHSDIQSKFGIFKQELLKYNSVKSVTAMLDPPGGEANDMFAFEMEDYNNIEMLSNNKIGVLPCDFSFADVFGLTFLAGNDFSPINEDNEGFGEYILNESAMKRLGYALPEEIIGKSFKLLQDENIKIPSGKVIGVVEDFRLSGIKRQVEPLVLFKRKDVWLINFVVSIEPGMLKKALSDIEQVWKKIFPEHPFEYRSVSSIYRHAYKAELLQTKLFSLFTIVSLFISSIGLLGLSLLTTQRRTKEIGIRVVNGARISDILTMLNWYFIKWILISFVIAIPLAWYSMHKWLENFAYKTTINVWIFGLAGLITIIIALLTVSLQSWKASSRNPVEALRYE